jgi:hypothetical protein
VAVSIAALGAAPAWAGFVGGGGSAAADCYVGLDVEGVSDTSSGKVECTEGDACDTGPCGDGKCTFDIEVCVNEAGVSGCTPPAGGLDSVKAAGPLKNAVPSTVTGAAWGNEVSLDVKLKKNGQKKNKRVIRAKATAGAASPGKDQDSFTFICKPRSGECGSSPSGAFLR